jgi:TonB-linked SusC/RagA family outer membrane protein
LNIKVRQVTLKELFKQIEAKSGYSVMYNNDLVNDNQRVDVNVSNASIEDVLKGPLNKYKLTFKIVDRQIVIYPETQQPTSLSKGEQRRKITVRGVVKDLNGSTIPGTTVTVLGTTRGVLADNDGSYSIEVSPQDKLVFTFLGMESQTIPVGSNRVINVTLEDKANELKDVTVVAFGTQKKESVVGSITTIQPSDLKVPSSNLSTALAGRMAGLISYQRSGEPGKDNAAFFIRGVTTFGYKKDPLILIDNNEVTTDELNKLQTDDIASFSIMKDATATSLYGSRGANGVILITTKEGKEGNAQMNVRFEHAMSQPTSMVQLADPVTYMELNNEAVRTRNPLGVTPYSQNKIDNTLNGGNPYVYPADDWYDIMFRNQALSERLNFSVSGGGKVATYYLAGSVSDDGGILKVDKMNNFNNNIDMKSYMLRSNVDINVTKTTKVNVRLQGSFVDYSGPIDGGTALFLQAMQSNPVLFPAYYKPDSANLFTQHVLFGNYDKGQYNNPYANMTRGYKDSTNSQMSVQFELTQKLDFITEGLSLRGMFNTDRYSQFSVSRFYTPFLYQVSSYNKAADQYTLSAINELSGTEYLSYNEGGKDINTTTYFESALNWNRTYHEKNALSALLVYTMREQLYGNAGDLQQSLPYRNLGLAGRATYAFDSRYFSEFNFGYNGSERFSSKHRFGFFPSAGLGWLVSDEAFWSELKNNINKLKLKATYGLVGNDAIGNANDRFFYLSNVNMNDGNHSASFGTYGNSGGNTLNGVSISRYANDDITWETAAKLNLGFELGLWKSLEIQADFYSENRYNILMDRSSIPSTMGLQSTVRANVGKASSKGTDISLNYNHSFSKDLWLTGMANFTYATSKFTQYEEPNYSSTPWLSHVGYSLNQNWGYVAERLFVDNEEVRNSPTQFGDYGAGDIKYKDINGDGKITALDMVPIGYPTSPDIVYGFGFSGGWKGFDLSCFFQGLARESFWIDPSATSPFIDGQSALLKVYADSHWSEDNRNLYALWPRLSPTLNTNDTQPSTWFMRDGSFLRLKSVEFGYTLPAKLVSRAKVTSLRLYFSGTNLLTFSKFKLWDPEMGGDGLGYPIQKVFNFGLQLSF